MVKLLDIFLQRNDPDVPWGFSIHGGFDRSVAPFVSAVTFGTLAAQHLNAGDRVLQIQRQPAGGLLQSELEGLLRVRGTNLHLLVEKLFCPKLHLSDPFTKTRKQMLRRQKKFLRLSEQLIDEHFRRMKEFLDDSWCLSSCTLRKQQHQPATGPSPASDGVQGPPAPPPPPPPSLPSTLPGRRLKTEIPERGLEPPPAIQNAMLTKDKKPFTYTPGGIDLSEIRSPKMQRRINRNACAEEMTGRPAPTTNQPVPAGPPPTTPYSAMQSQLPTSVLPARGMVPPPPPPFVPQDGLIPPPPPSSAASAPILPSPQQKQSAFQKPPQMSFDPNEILARASRNQTQEVAATKPNNFGAERRPEDDPQKVNDAPPVVNKPQSPGQIYVPPVTPKSPVEPPVANHSPRGQLGSIYVPPVPNNHQEQSTPSPSSPFGQRIQSQSPAASPMSPPAAAESKQQAPWVTVYRTPQTPPAWMSSRQPESPKFPESSKPQSTRIIPIQIEGRDPPKQQQQSSYGSQQQFNNQQAYSTQQQQQQFANQPYNTHQQQQQYIVQQESKQQNRPHTRVIPIQIEGVSVQSQQGYQTKFNPMTPTSPTPYCPPSADKEHKPQWAPVQPRPLSESQFGQQKTQGDPQPRMQPQPEYGTYNTAGMPLSQLRKMQLSEDDRALMDKFKSQIEKHGNDAITDENANPRYRGGHIPSRVFKMLDESVDDEKYLHQESDPRYRGATIPSRAFRLLQNMTDTAGDLSQQVPKGPMRAPASRPPQSASEPSAGPYIPASEQQVQEPKKYTGGSIPSRSFRMLQAMTGQEVTAQNHAKANASSGRSTPVPPMGRWCPSPVPPQFDPYWYLYHSDPYLMYNYISDMNASYGYLPSQPYPAGRYTPNHFQPHSNCMSDSDEQGYSSTDELGQYYMNYRNSLAYPPFLRNQDPYYPNGRMDEYSGSRCSTPGIMTTPPAKSGRTSAPPLFQENKITEIAKMVVQDVKSSENEDCSIESESSTEGETEPDTDEEIDISSVQNESEEMCKSGTLQTLKSVSDIGLYASESSATVTNEEEWEVEKKEEEDHEDDDDDEGEEEEEEEESTSESFQVSQENLPHQLSVIYEESEHSDVESMRQKSTTKSITSESDTSNLENGEEESDDDGLDMESSVTVRLPLRLKFSRGENDEDVTTVIVGDSEVRRSEEADEVTEETEEDDEEEADVSVTFSLPTRSNSVISVGKKTEKENQAPEKPHEFEKGERNEIKVEADAEVTVSLLLKKPKSSTEEKAIGIEANLDRLSYDSKTEESDSNHFEDDSSSTSADTVVKPKEDSDDETSDKLEKKVEDFKPWNSGNEKDCKEKTVLVESKDEISYEAGVERLEKMISSMLEKAKWPLEPEAIGGQMKVRKENSQEESEDDSGVTSDMSVKHLASETDTESDYSELSKMTQCQRASTHSRLFKLLQEECGSEDMAEEEKKKEPKLSGSAESLTLRKQRLTLPLSTSSEVESLSSSSGVASPASPTVTDRLIKELVHSLLHKKKGKKFRKLPLAKLHAAALRILQEDMDPYDTSSNSASGDDGFLLSPHPTHSPKTAAAAGPNLETDPAPDVVYGANYYDYLNYYNTWGNAASAYYPEQDIVPSKAFRMLSMQQPAAMEGLRAKCPRIPNSGASEGVPERPTGRQTPCVTPRGDFAETFPGNENKWPKSPPNVQEVTLQTQHCH